MSQQKQLEILYSPINTAQKEVKKKWADSKILILRGVAGSGKAQPLDSLVMTPSGPKEMRFISVGEEVLTKTGITTVAGIYPQGIKQVYSVKFDDGSYVRCCGDHLWEVILSNNKKAIKTTNELRDTLHTHKYKVEAPHPAKFTTSFLHVIDPYFLGYIIAKGAIKYGAITFDVYGNQIKEILQSKLPKEYKLKKINSKYKHILLCDNPSNDIIYNFLEVLNIHNCTPYDIFIPKEYLYADIQQRQELLQGLMDGDGGVDRGHAEYYTSSPALKEDVMFLIRSLGGICRVRSKHMSNRVVSHTIRFKVPFVPFKWGRKASAYKLKDKPLKKSIVDIVPTCYEECQCISLNGEEKLYLTDAFTPTHNTSAALGHSLIDLQKGKIDKIMLCRPTVAVEEELGHLPGDMNEKLLPWMGSFLDVLGDMSHLKTLEGLPIELVAIGMLRGRTVKRAVLIVDEAQNLTFAQLKCVVTRVGREAKIVLCGDPSQSDLNYSPNPFDETANKLSIVEGCNLINFTKEHQVREAFINDILSVLEGWGE